MSHRNEKEILAFVQGKGLQFFGSDARDGWVDFEPTEQDLAAQDLLSGQGAYEFRIKPRTVKIGSVEIEAPVLEPMDGQRIWYVNAGGEVYSNTPGNVRQEIASGHAFASREAALAAFEAITALLRGEA